MPILFVNENHKAVKVMFDYYGRPIHLLVTGTCTDYLYNKYHT